MGFSLIPHDLMSSQSSGRVRVKPNEAKPPSLNLLVEKVENSRVSSLPFGRTVLNDFIKMNTTLTIATWNVRSLLEAGKLESVTREMERMGIDILGVSETRCRGNGKYHSGEYAVYHSGCDEDQHRSGVSVIASKSVEGAVKNFVPLSDRVLLLRMRARPVNVNVVQVYAPSEDADEGVLDSFYEDVKAVLKLTAAHEVNVVMGDFNAKVGRGRVEGVVGPFGLGTRDERGDKLVRFCQEEGLVAMNTWFELPKRRLYTWKSPLDKPGNVVRDQIDYILVNGRFRNAVPSVTARPGADVGSDHNPLLGKLKVRLHSTGKRNAKTRVDSAMDATSNRARDCKGSEIRWGKPRSSGWPKTIKRSKTCRTEKETSGGNQTWIREI